MQLPSTAFSTDATKSPSHSYGKPIPPASSPLSNESIQGEPSDLASARQLLDHIKAGLVKDGFAPRDVEMRKWKRLKTLGEIEGAIVVLCDHGFLREV